MQKIKDVSEAAQKAKALRDQAEREGYEDRKAGVSVGKNRYKSGPGWTGWRVGWFKANGES